MTDLLLLLALAALPARAAEPALTFLAKDDAVVLKVTAADLRARKDVRRIGILDPLYGKQKLYRAVPIKNLLSQAYGGIWIENGTGEFYFDALDGYRSHAPVPVLAEDGGMLVFADEDFPDWEPLPKRGDPRPGPFYLVWTGEKQGLNDHPWPYQILSVKSALAEDEFPKAVPRNYSPKSRAPQGWKLFRTDCISCHAMNGQGGTVGPDLNEPRGVTSYHDKEHLKAYIRKASSFRHTKMPDFGELTPKDLDDLMAYFDFMAVQSGTK